MKKYLKHLMATGVALAGIMGGVALSSCGGAKDKNLTGTMTVKATAKTLEITCGIKDPDNIVNKGSARVAVYTYDDNNTPDDKSDDKETLVENKTFSDIPNDDNTLETKVINNLKINQDYLLKFYCTYSDQTHIFEETHYKTTSKGQSEENPIEISTADQLFNMTSDLTAYYKLVDDIDVTKYSQYNETKGVSPIFSSSKIFEGSFDGNGHKIKGFNQKESNQYSGVFGYIGENGKVENLIIEDPVVSYTRSSTVYYGAVAGYNKGEISNVSVTNANLTYTVTTTSTQSPAYCGGFVGLNEGTITNSSIEGVISSTYRGKVVIGGFVGTNMKKISDSKASVDISLAYGTSSSSVEIVTFDVGGFAGNSDGSITNSISTGSLDINYSFTATNTSINKYIPHNLGGFIGLYNGGIIKGCVVDEDITFTSSQSLITNLGVFSGSISTGLNPQAFKSNVVIGNSNTINITLLDKDGKFNYERNIPSDTDENKTEMTDRKFNFGLFNTLDEKYFENFYKEHDMFALEGTLSITLDATDYAKASLTKENEFSANYKDLTLSEYVLKYIESAIVK